MNKIKNPSRVWQIGFKQFVASMLMAVWVPVNALPQIEGLDNDQISVRELMQLDTGHALQLARERSGGTGQSAVVHHKRTVRKMSGEPRLKAIYGVGQQLMAEVAFDQVIYLYRHGQALPVGVAAGEDVYLLENITSSCVDLRTSETSHHLCLQPAQWVGK